MRQQQDLAFWADSLGTRMFIQLSSSAFGFHFFCSNSFSQAKTKLGYKELKYLWRDTPSLSLTLAPPDFLPTTFLILISSPENNGFLLNGFGCKNGFHFSKHSWPSNVVCTCKWEKFMRRRRKIPVAAAVFLFYFLPTRFFLFSTLWLFFAFFFVYAAKIGSYMFKSKSCQTGKSGKTLKAPPSAPKGNCHPLLVRQGNSEIRLRKKVEKVGLFCLPFHFDFELVF